MDISVTRDHGIPVLRVEEQRLDALVALDFKEAVRLRVQPSDKVMVLDLSQVQFLDSSGLGAVVWVMKLFESPGALHLVGLRPAVARVFELTRMDRVFAIHEDKAEALSAMRGMVDAGPVTPR